jgi:hypothetical protein
MLNLSEAARESKQSKSAIWRAVNSGRLSATRTYSGDYQIDPAELHRVFSSETADERATTVSMRRGATELERAEAALMQEQIERLFQAGAVRLTGCASWLGDLQAAPRSIARAASGIVQN